MNPSIGFRGIETSSSHPYSRSFQDLIKDESHLRKLLEESHIFTEPWSKDEALKGWEDGRRFITQGLNKDGSILDYGCANGFLLKCLQEWSPRKLDPYGMDIDTTAIEKAKELFPTITDHFTTPEEMDIRPEYPHEFDMVYWNVWDNYDFEDQQSENLLKSLLKATKKNGRLILGFYDTKEKNRKTIEQIKKLGYVSSGVLENPSGEEIIVWFDKAN